MNMLEELKRCNNIGSKEGLLFLVEMIIDRDIISLREISNRCALRPNLNVNYKGALAFLEFLEFIRLKGEFIELTNSGKIIFDISRENIIDYISKCCINKLIQESVFNNDAFEFDEKSGNVLVKKHVFTLSLASIRNYLITNDVFLSNIGNGYEINPKFEEFFTLEIKKHSKTKSLEQLLEQQKKQQEQGLKAEELVLNYEKKRLSAHPLVEKIKRISDFDVLAGYDIVSYCTNSDLTYNRFIEVKSYKGYKHFFWSENELDVAKLKGETYFLCLVDIDKIHEHNYQPEFIQSPAGRIFSDDEWMITPSSYRIISTSR